MKKIFYFFWFIFAVCISDAKPVIIDIARQAAMNFYTQLFPAVQVNLSLTYTEYSMTGEPLYYVFDVADNKGFVIISANDAAHPVIGYSITGHFIKPDKGSNMDYWMQHRKNEIAMIVAKNLQPSEEIQQEWSNYINNVSEAQGKVRAGKITSIFPSNSAYLVQTLWDQTQYYNTDCPGNSVTGCVATTMAQIMKYWGYPAHGLYSHTYSDNTLYGYQDDWGALSSNFYSHSYNWANMPTGMITSPNADVAQLMYDAGVSVDMDYDPLGSGAYVTLYDNYPDSVCAQFAYSQFFGYNKYTMKKAWYAYYTMPNWLTLLENELNNNRPIEYTGDDSINPNNNVGHSWVCDGYNSQNLFHMNWGWSGQDNGWFAVNNLNDGSGDDWNTDLEVLTGIEPPAASADFYATKTSIIAGSAVSFTDNSLCPANATLSSYSWSFSGGTPSTSNSPTPTITYNNPGIYSVQEIVTSTAGSDTIIRNNYIVVQPQVAYTVPSSEGFEEPNFPPPGWYLNNPNNWDTSEYGFGKIWQPWNVGGYGNSNHCMVFQNWLSALPIGGQRQQIYSPAYNFSKSATGVLYFDIAYSPFNSQYNDTLVIYYSLNGGNTWTQVYSKGGATLETSSDFLGGNATWIPSSAEWRTDTINLPSALDGQADVMFSFENRSYNGGGIYMDNVTITAGPLSVQNITNPNDFTVYPNPNQGEFNIQRLGVSSHGLENAEIQIFNMYGQEIYSTTTHQPLYTIHLNVSTGIYFIRIVLADGSTMMKKVEVVH